METTGWTYDGGVFGIGRMTTMSDPTGSTAYAYDRRGLLIRETKTVGGGTYTTRYAYDRDGNRTAVTYPSGRVAEEPPRNSGTEGPRDFVAAEPRCAHEVAGRRTTAVRSGSFSRS
ncbi:MAG: RHS repeat domain-containing protein [Thermoanaerobaculia bacterium]